MMTRHDSCSECSSTSRTSTSTSRNNGRSFSGSSTSSGSRHARNGSCSGACRTCAVVAAPAWALPAARPRPAAQLLLLLQLLLLQILLQHVSAAHALEIDQDTRDDAFIGWHEGKVHEAGGPGSGLGAAQGVATILLRMAHGDVRISPRADAAPRTVQLVASLARAGVCTQCRFYRHEPVPKAGNNPLGPPYALLQGSLADMEGVPPAEGTDAEISRGDVLMIPGTKEFFIATGPHPDWGGVHTVWGRIDGAIDSVPFEPASETTDRGITTRWLAPEVVTPFTIHVEEAAGSGMAREAGAGGMPKFVARRRSLVG